MFDFSNKTVVITGGTKGMGLAIAKKFVGAGARVFVGARHSTRELKDLGPQLKFVKMDVRDLAQMRRLVNMAVETTQRLDVFINNAGISIWKSIDHVDEEFWNTLIDTNLKGCYWGCKAAAEKLTDGGIIINIASLAGKRGSKNNSVYVASKFGVVGITQALAKELGERGIRVNGICPVYGKTEALLSNLCGDHPDVGDTPPEVFLEEFAQQNAALKRIPLAEEIADTCLYLASPYSSAITGQNINVDCGVLPQ